MQSQESVNHALTVTAPKSRTAEATPTPRATSTAAQARSKVSSATKRIDDLSSFGNFAMQAGRDAEAITSFESLVELCGDPTEAWGKLAFLYLKQGDAEKAVQAFKRAKSRGDANGGIVTRDGSRGLQFP